MKEWTTEGPIDPEKQDESEENEPIQEDYNDSLEDVDNFNRETGGGYW